MNKSYLFLFAIAIAVLCAAWFATHGLSKTSTGEVGATLSELPPKKTSEGKAQNDRSGLRYLNRKAFLLHGTGSPIEGNARDALDRLIPLANAGDASAAYAIYLKVYDCKSKLSSPIDDKSLRQYMRAGIAEAKLAAIERAQEECSGLTKEEYRNAGAWLEKAAERGSVPAQLVYVSDPEAVVGDASEMMRDPERVKDYKNKSMRYMQSAANNGSIDAILKLGNAYSAGVLTERDSFKSVAYYSAIGLMDQSLVPQVRFSVLANELTPNQRAAALQQGRKIYEQCCAP